MTGPRISAIVPTYNGERFLAAALASVLGQTQPPLEVIVADDGSSDATCEIALDAGSPVRLVRQSRKGAAAARNLGLSAAIGDLVAFIDQDDLWVPDKLARQWAAFAAHAALDVCVGHIQRFRDDSATAERHLAGEPVPGFLSVTMLARREAFATVGGFDPARRYSDSADWFLRARAAGLTVALLPELLTLHRDHDANLSLIEGDQSRAEFLRLIRDKVRRERGGAEPA